MMHQKGKSLILYPTPTDWLNEKARIATDDDTHTRESHLERRRQRRNFLDLANKKNAPTVTPTTVLGSGIGSASPTASNL